MNEYTVLVIFVFAFIGMCTVARWLGEHLGTAAWRVDCWSHERAYNLCGQAILDYEFDRGVDGVTAYRYAHRMM